MEKHAYEDWKSTVVTSISKEKDKDGMVSDCYMITHNKYTIWLHHTVSI